MRGWLKHCDSGGLYLKYISVIQDHIDYYYKNVIYFKKKESEESSMENLNGVMYDDRPEEVIVRPTSVDVMTLIEPVNVTDEMSGKTSVKFKCNVERYTTSEYIDKLKTDNANLNTQVTQAQMGLAEVYELIAGGM